MADRTEDQSIPRKTRGPSRQGPRPGELTERDVELLVEVWRFRYLSVSQVQALLFPSRQTALRRLKFLSENGYLQAFRVPGIEEGLVALDALGAERVAEQLLVPLPELGWSKKSALPSDPWFLRHFLLVSWFRIELTKQVQDHASLELLGFIPEYVGEAREGGGIKKYLREVVVDRKAATKTKLTHTPDAVFALGRKDPSGQVKQANLFFLEIDRGTEVVANPEKGVLKTLRFYLSLMETGQHNRYAKDFGVESFIGFRVLFVTTSEARIQNIRTVASRFPWNPEKAKRFIWLAPLSIIKENHVLSGYWCSLDLGDEKRYVLG